LKISLNFIFKRQAHGDSPTILGMKMDADKSRNKSELKKAGVVLV